MFLSAPLLPAELPIQAATAAACSRQGMDDQRERGPESPGPATSSPDVRLKLAKTLVRKNQPDSAQKVLEELISASPDLAEAHAELGLLLLEKQEYEHAARELGRAVQLVPESSKYSLGLAEVLLRWHHYSTALEFLKAANQRFGSLPLFKYDLAYSYYGMRQFDAAISIANDLLRQHPRFDLAYYLLGNCYMQLGDLEAAETSYKKALELNSRKPAYFAALAEVKRYTNKTDEGLRLLEKAHALDATDSEVILQLALCHEKNGNLENAQALLEQLTVSRPELIVPHRVLSRVYQRQGKKEEAIKEKQRAAALEGQHRKGISLPGGNSSHPGSSDSLNR
jgi:cytochrome c-type biogenesis protein CcmH/NrfG